MKVGWIVANQNKTFCLKTLYIQKMLYIEGAL